MTNTQDTRLFLVDALEQETLYRLKGCLLKFASYLAVSTTTKAAFTKIGVFHIARTPDSNEVQLKVLQKVAPQNLKDLHSAFQRIKTTDAWKKPDTRKIGVCIKSLIEHVTREGHLGGSACHIYIMAHGYQPTNGLATLLQAASSANIHFHFLHIKTEADSSASELSHIAAGQDPAATAEAQLAIFAADFAQLENVTTDILDGDPQSLEDMVLSWAAPLLLPGPSLQLELVLPLQGLAGAKVLHCRQLPLLAPLQLDIQPVATCACHALPTSSGPAGARCCSLTGQPLPPGPVDPCTLQVGSSSYLRLAQHSRLQVGPPRQMTTSDGHKMIACVEKLVRVDDVNELLLLGDPIVLTASDDVCDGAHSSGASSSSQAAASNAQLLAGLSQELLHSGRALLVSSYQDAAQRCSRGFRMFYLLRPCVQCLGGGAGAGGGGAQPVARQLVMRRMACAEQILPLDAASLAGVSLAASAVLDDAYLSGLRSCLADWPASGQQGDGFEHCELSCDLHSTINALVKDSTKVLPTPAATAPVPAPAAAAPLRLQVAGMQRQQQNNTAPYGATPMVPHPAHQHAQHQQHQQPQQQHHPQHQQQGPWPAQAPPAAPAMATAATPMAAAPPAAAMPAQDHDARLPPSAARGSSAGPRQVVQQQAATGRAQAAARRAAPTPQNAQAAGHHGKAGKAGRSSGGSRVPAAAAAAPLRSSLNFINVRGEAASKG